MLSCRLYGVMEEHLKKGHKYLAADQYSIADIACLSWAFSAPWAGEASHQQCI